MLPKEIRELIRLKCDLNTITSHDCKILSKKIGVSTTTAKRMFGLLNSDENSRMQHRYTLNLVARFLGFDTYDSLLQNIEGKIKEEEIQPKDSMCLNLSSGQCIQLVLENSGVINITYLGELTFAVKINEGINGKKDSLIKNQ